MNQLGKNPFHYIHFMLERTSISSWVLVLLLFFAFGFVSGRDGDGVVMTQSDFQTLKAIEQDFIDPRRVLKSWNGSINGACSGEWVGITCLKGEVVSINLPWKGLGGKISEKIGQLQSLRRLSLHDNYLTGPIPDSLGLLPNLRAVYLFNNRLSGSIPLSIAQSSGLQTLHLSNNKLSGTIPPNLSNSTRIYRLNLSFNSLSGSIPASLTQSPSLYFLSLQYNNLSGSVPDSWGEQGGKLYQLQVLTLDHNHLNGSIPETIGNITGISQLDFSYNNFTGLIPISLSNLHNLTYFNVSYNNLSGIVPTLLSEEFNSSSFVGNLQLCGYSGSSQCPSPPQVPPSSSPEGLPHSHRKLSTKDIILIAAGALLLVLLLLCFLLLCCLIRKRAKKAKNSKNDGRVEKAVPASGGEVESGGEVGGKLVHFDGPFVFAADDLLCATAEIMGKSTYGTIYKATLEDGNQVAVKRLREKVAKGQKDFETEVVALGKIRHPNVLALRAYYLGPKGEKLLVFDYMPNGSLASFLHGKQSTPKSLLFLE